MMTVPDDYNVVYVPFSGDIRAAVRVDCDGYPTIYINVNLSPEGRKQALNHELHHIAAGDFWNHVSIYDAEADAIRSETLNLYTRADRAPTPEEYAALVDTSVRLFGAVNDAARLPVPEALRRLRTLKGLSQDELAAVLQLPPDVIRASESAAPDAETLRKLSEFYGVTLCHAQKNSG